MATSSRTILETLLDAEVEFVVVGGVALVARGAPRTTEDIDICYRRDDANLERLLADLAFIAEIKSVSEHARTAASGASTRRTPADRFEQG